MKQFPFNGTIMVINRTRFGSYKTNLHGEMEYQSFVPAKLPPNPQVVMNDEMVILLLDTHQIRRKHGLTGME